VKKREETELEGKKGTVEMPGKVLLGRKAY
jgi:hypothetical protein